MATVWCICVPNCSINLNRFHVNKYGLLTKREQGVLDIGQVLSCVSMDRDPFEIHEHANTQKKKNKTVNDIQSL